ncbi:MAG: molybdenum cofactor biosynthesis protein B [Planctomycetota bacterium]|nr:molybdenum cofactor biosynthesis protein B [Planctomycetota bacterium]MDA1113432.1 molybdenum cofactor biosynthesis protein B [Planctomycetota bacterium]
MSQATPKAHGGTDRAFLAQDIRVLTISDSRDLSTDKSGALLEDLCKKAGHQVSLRKVIADEQVEIQKTVAAWAAEKEVDVILVTGGTGITSRDVTPEAVEPLYDKALPGFGELFRQLSFAEIGTACIQSRASAGLIAKTVVFVMPGSTGACRLAAESIILPQLDARTRPCSFPELRDAL